MNILITGASGFIGQHVLQACMDRGHQVTACVRNPSGLQPYYPHLQLLPCDFSEDHDEKVWLPRVSGMDVVVNAAGVFRQRGRNTFESLHSTAVRALFKACETANVGKVIQISALGADNSAFSQYHLSKKAADDYLSQLKLHWLILQPSIVYGPGAKSLRLFQALADLPYTPLVGTGEQRIQPIYIDDLVRAVITAVERDTVHHQRLAAVGPEPVTIRAMYGLLKHWQGMAHARFFKIPLWLAIRAAHLAGLSRNSLINADAVKMLQNGNTARVQPFVAAFGFTPRGLQQGLYGRSPLPGEQLDYTLYFLLPLLRISLALLWIATGFISAFAYPAESSYDMLRQVGVADHMLPVALYGAALLDSVLGAALLFGYFLRGVLILQMLAILVYTAVITVGLPQLWLHPFGPVTKNIPLLVTTWILLRMEK